MAPKSNWFEILKAARKLSGNQFREFSSDDVAREAGIRDTRPSVIKRGARAGQMGAGSRGPQIAGGWLAKFVKWGYVQVSGTVPSGGPKPSNVYKVTPLGMTCQVRLGVRERLMKLLDAVKAFRDLRGRPAEQQAWKDLLKTLNDVDVEEDEADGE